MNQRLFQASETKDPMGRFLPSWSGHADKAEKPSCEFHTFSSCILISAAALISAAHTLAPAPVSSCRRPTGSWAQRLTCRTRQEQLRRFGLLSFHRQPGQKRSVTNGNTGKCVANTNLHVNLHHVGAARRVVAEAHAGKSRISEQVIDSLVIIFCPEIRAADVRWWKHPMMNR